MAVAFVFPGQGSQVIGMGKLIAEASAAARHVFQEVDDALGQNLSDLIWNGSEVELTLTENAQPALMAVSLAACRMLEIDFGIKLENIAKCVAGHSLGEYSALAAAGTFTVADAARLLRTRGKAMQAATPVGVGAMAAILGLDFTTVSQAASEAALSVTGDVCQVANDNTEGQVVLSGHKAAVERACEIAKAKGAKRAVMLQVSAPFHCALMQPAADAMAEALARATVLPPSVPVISNVTASPVSSPDDIRRLLVAQVTGTVRWRECVAAMSGLGVNIFAEIGSGKVLSGLAKKNAPEALALTASTPDDVIALAAKLKG
jgi:[acyl-carrier-protein] S-malonyltransferase